MNPEWRYVQGYSGTVDAQRCYRDNALGVQRETITKRKANGEWGKQRDYYFIDGDKREFRDEEDLMDALEARESKCVCVTCGQKIRTNPEQNAEPNP